MGIIEDTFTCRNTAGTSRLLCYYITLLGFCILAAGIADVITFTTKCQTWNNPITDYTIVGVGVWGSLPIIFTGVLAIFLIDNTAFTVKFLQLASLASGFLFAPAVVVISAIDAAMAPRTCGDINSYAISICLASFGGAAFIELGVLSFRLYCAPPVDDQQHYVTGSRVQRVYATKDEFMVSDMPSNPILNNGASKVIDTRTLPTNQIHMPLNMNQRSQTSWGYAPSQGQYNGMYAKGQGQFNGVYAPAQGQISGVYGPTQGQISGVYGQGQAIGVGSSQVVLQQAPFNAPPKQQLALAQLQQSSFQSGTSGGEQNYYVSFLPQNKIVTNAYPQIFKMSG